MPPEAAQTPAEYYARTLATARGQDLALALPTALVSVAVACQGSVTVALPVQGGIHDIPVILHHVGLAPSGAGKSTTQESIMAPVREAMRAVQVRRRDILAQWQTNMLTATPTGQANAIEAIDRILSPHPGEDFVSAATPEALRNILADGAAVAVIASEGDVYRDQTAYTQASASMAVWTTGWDRHPWSVSRVGAGTMSLHTVTLNQSLLLQPQVFTDYAANADFLSKGVLHRTLITRAEIPENEDNVWQMAEDDSVPEAPDAPGSTVAGARLTFTDRLTRIGERAAPNRCERIVANRRDALMAEKTPTARAVAATAVTLTFPAVGDVRLRLSPAARKEVNALQQVRGELLAATRAEDPDNDYLSLFERVTSHVLRLAAVQTLARDPDATVITAAMVHDAGTRLWPWLFAHWSGFLLHRTEDVATTVMEEKSGKTSSVDLDSETLVVAALGRLAQQAGDLQMGVPCSRWWSATELGDAVGKAFGWSVLKKITRGGVTALAQQMPNLVESRTVPPASGGKRKAGGRPRREYRLTMTGARRAMQSGSLGSDR